ncbi:MAG: RNA polymerase sigma factor [Deltaproteobacteria bacterium]|nr:RNA polymerase sigma factor [Deltaproteobacteria bacterium]
MSSLEHTSERELATACADGQRQAWSELIRRHSRRVTLVLVRTLPGASLSELDDVRQEVWTRLLLNDRAALRGLRFELEGSLAAYLAQVALRVAIDHGRRRAVRLQPGEGLEAAMPIAHPQASQENRVIDEDLRRRVSQALERVVEGDNGPRDLAVLKAHFEDGLNPAEIERMGFGLGAKGVESLVRRAKEKLTAIFSEGVSVGRAS